jgi:phospho-N-acetylmuramoyl-pentapeptide-transferase
MVGLLRRWGVGKAVNPWGPASHRVKEGTPTMGGVLIWGPALVVAGLEATRHSAASLPAIAMGGLALLGLIDDLGSLSGRRQWALNKRLKLLALVAVGLGVALALYLWQGVDWVRVPGLGRYDLGAWIVPVGVMVVALTAGGVAVTDGLDGLAAGLSAVAYAALGAVALVQGQEAVGAFALAVVGACLGFLWYNSHPAQVFMGDTGALALGGGLAAVALVTGQWLALPLVGIVFVLEGASVYLQVAYFRLTGGKRILRMAPLHHHLEALGWPEPRVVQRLWMLGALGAMAGVILALEAQ